MAPVVLIVAARRSGAALDCRVGGGSAGTALAFERGATVIAFDVYLAGRTLRRGPREALAALETLRTVPIQAVERSSGREVRRRGAPSAKRKRVAMIRVIEGTPVWPAAHCLDRHDDPQPSVGTAGLDGFDSA